jgi:hypothetical protein
LCWYTQPLRPLAPAGGPARIGLALRSGERAARPDAAAGYALMLLHYERGSWPAAGSAVSLARATSFAMHQKAANKLLYDCCQTANLVLARRRNGDYQLLIRQLEHRSGSPFTARATEEVRSPPLRPRPPSRARCPMVCEDSRGVPGRQQMLRVPPLPGGTRSARRLRRHIGRRLFTSRLAAGRRKGESNEL